MPAPTTAILLPTIVIVQELNLCFFEATDGSVALDQQNGGGSWMLF